MAKSGASKGAKFIDAHNEGNLEGVNVAQGNLRKVEDIKQLSPQDQVKGMEIIRKTSRGLSRDRRMENFFKDLYDD